MTLAENFGWWDAVRTVYTASCWGGNGDLGTGYSEKQGTGYRENSKISFIRCFSVLSTDFTYCGFTFNWQQIPPRVVKNTARHQGTQLGTKNLSTRGVYLQKILVPESDSRKKTKLDPPVGKFLVPS